MSSYKACLLLFLFPLLFAAACSPNPKSESRDADYQKQIETWRGERIQGLTAPNGWLSLAGLFWLDEGENTFGSNKDNKIVFPSKAPDFMGSFFLNEESVSLKIKAGVQVFWKDSLISEAAMQADAKGQPPIFRYQSLNWNVLKRGVHYGIRLRDTLNETITAFKGIEYYPVLESWKVAATFVPYDSLKILPFQNVLGMKIEESVEGQLKFNLFGKAYALDVLDGGEKEFFVIFGDETNGEQTYGGGKYLYAPRPDSEGQTFIDFNKSYTPPCGFTKYATCLLPPLQNRLPLSVTAGEKYHGH